MVQAALSASVASDAEEGRVSRRAVEEEAMVAAAIEASAAEDSAQTSVPVKAAPAVAMPPTSGWLMCGGGGASSPAAVSRAVVRSDFVAEAGDELLGIMSVPEGAVVEVLDTAPMESWWLVRLGSAQGLVPAEFCEAFEGDTAPPPAQAPAETSAEDVSPAIPEPASAVAYAARIAAMRARQQQPQQAPPVAAATTEVPEAVVLAHRPAGTLHGWLLKRHAKPSLLGNISWAKRYFMVNDTRGVLGYMNEERSKKDTTGFLLADITGVVEETGDHVGGRRNCCFSITFKTACPPNHHLVLQAEDREECMEWVRGLQQRAQIWRDQAASTRPWRPAALHPLRALRAASSGDVVRPAELLHGPMLLHGPTRPDDAPSSSVSSHGIRGARDFKFIATLRKKSGAKLPVDKPGEKFVVTLKKPHATSCLGIALRGDTPPVITALDPVGIANNDGSLRVGLELHSVNGVAALWHEQASH
jgi:hypothetical protein